MRHGSGRRDGEGTEVLPVDTYFRSLRSADARGASSFVLEMFDEGTPVQQITSEVLDPAQVRVGELWQQGDWSVADEHAATVVTEAAVMALGHASRPRVLSDTRHIVLACPEGEWHTLPARMTAVVSTSPGTRVTVLGPSLPADQLARRLSPRLATMNPAQQARTREDFGWMARYTAAALLAGDP